MENLPQNWVIDTQKEKDSPLMSKFMEWFKQKYDGVNDFNYFGVYNNKFGTWWDIQRETEITLEQWNAFYFPEWQPKQGERVMVSNYKDRYCYERVFVVKHNETYYCENQQDISELIPWKYVMQLLPKESILQPLVDQLKAEAKKLGIEKVNITFE